MSLKNTSESFGWLAKFFHWLIFIVILCLLIIGFNMTDMPNSPDKFKLYGLHKATGIAVLWLVFFRLIWKSVNISPELPDSMDSWQKAAAKASHFALYILIIAMPLSGWALSSAAGFPVSVFGLFTMPNIVAPNKELLSMLREAHEIIAYLIIIVVIAHATAALLHHFYYKDNVLIRMLPFVKGRK